MDRNNQVLGRPSHGSTTEPATMCWCMPSHTFVPSRLRMEEILVDFLLLYHMVTSKRTNPILKPLQHSPLVHATTTSSSSPYPSPSPFVDLRFCCATRQ